MIPIEWYFDMINIYDVTWPRPLFQRNTLKMYLKDLYEIEKDLEKFVENSRILTIIAFHCFSIFIFEFSFCDQLFCLFDLKLK